MNFKCLGKKGPQEPEPSVSDDRSSEYSTCQSNESAGSIGTSSKHSVDPEYEISRVPPNVYVSTPITTNEKGVSAPKSKEVEPSCVSHIKTPRQPIKDQETPKVNRKNWNAMMERELGEGYSFTKKKCFVCGSLSHLIKDCDYYEKKMAKEAEVKKQRVCNTGNMMAKPVWTNTNRINHANQFVPRPVQLNSGRPNINSVRTNINTGRTNINSVRPRVNTVNTNVNTVRSRQPVPTRTSNSFSPKRPQVNLFNQRRHFSKSHSSVRRPFAKNTAQMSRSHAVKGNWGTAVKTSAGYNWRNSKPNSNCDSGPTFIRTVNAKGNKEQLEILKNSNGGSVNLWRLKGYIPCDKQHKVLFTETKCLVVSFDFKMPDENQILLKVPRHHNMYSFDMKTPTPAKGFAYLIAKATSKNQNWWHRSYLDFCGNQGKKQEYNNARTPQQNEVAERMNGTLIEAARTMLADSLFPTTYWGRSNTLSVLGKFDGKSDEGFLVGYSLNSKAYRVYNLVTKRVEVNMHVNFLEDKLNVKGEGASEVTNSAEPQQEKKASSTDTSEDNPKILALRRELEEIALKHLGTVSENNSTSTPSVNTGGGGRRGNFFDEASYDEEGVITDFNSLPTEIEVSPTPTLRIHNIHPKSQILGDPKSAVQTRSKENPKKISIALQDDIDLPPGNEDEFSIGELHIFLRITVKQTRQESSYLRTTATANTLADGTLELHATIDTTMYTITEASIRNKLQLADASGITMLPNNEIFEGMGHMGNMKRGFRGVPRPLLPAMLPLANLSAGQEAPSVTQPQPSSNVVPPTPTTTQPIPSEATTIPPLSQPAPPTPIAETTNASPSPTLSPAHEPMEHIFEQPSSDQQPPSPRQDATTSQLMARIDDLEKQLKETKQTFGKAILTLVERVKSLEVALKRKTKRVLLSDSEEEETEAQGRKFHDLDPLVSLLQELVTPSKTPSKTVNASGEEQVEDISPTTLEAAAILTKVKSAFEEVNTGSIKVSTGIEEINAGSLDVNTGSDPVTTDSIRVSVPSPDRGRREGKAPMTEEEETQASKKIKEQILQEEAGLAEAIRLDALEKALEKEEVAKQVHLDSLLAQRMAEEQELTEEQKKRKDQVQFEAQSYTEEDWDTTRAKLEANAELKESVHGNDLSVEDYAKRMVELVNQRRKHFAEERARAKRNKPMTQTQLRNYMSNFIEARDMEVDPVEEVEF
ncbi:ribonuclease H-like domain-containing protein [Tanacetum coccineum]